MISPRGSPLTGRRFHHPAPPVPPRKSSPTLSVPKEDAPPPPDTSEGMG